MTTISDRIKLGMELRGLKQADIVERSGINKGALSCYISGKYQPKQNGIYLLAKALDVNEAWLMGADVPMERLANSVSSPCSADEESLLTSYRQLNRLGKSKAREYVSDLAENAKYIKDTESLTG